MAIDRDSVTSGNFRSNFEEITNEQLREMKARLDSLESSNLAAPNMATTNEIVPIMVNQVDNSDFTYSDDAYRSDPAYTDDEDVLAHWYGRTQATATSYTENSGSESSESIRSSAHGSGARTGVEWDTTTGAILLTGGYRVAGKLPIKFAKAGNCLYFRAQMSRVSGATAPDEDIKLKVSLWDNTDNEIIEGGKPVLTLSKIGTHSGGAFRREYILEVRMPDGRRFFSDTSSPPAVTNTVSATPVDADDYVKVEIPQIIGVSKYIVYRRMTNAGAGNNGWFLVETITNDSAFINDKGGSGGGEWTIPTLDEDNKEYPLAEAYVDDYGSYIQEEDKVNEVVMCIKVPDDFVQNGDQFLQIEFVKSDYTNTTTGEIAADSIRIDKVGLSVSNGRWMESARDQNLTPTLTTPSAPIPSGGGGGGGNPPAGGSGDEGEGSGILCVERGTNILVWRDNLNHAYESAYSITKGDKLVSWDGEKFVPSVVKKVINGESSVRHTLLTENNILHTSISHRVIENNFDLEYGTQVRVCKEVLEYLSDTSGEIMGTSKVVAKELLDHKIKVVTYILEGVNNYIANGILSHNLKPEEPLEN